MENIVNIITQGEAAFTPAVLVSLIIFVMIIDCLGSIASNLLRIGR